ncbi:MAG: hypothetical protein CSA75_05505 [Sorangium cellulosum]|nr:MAG: hypothetical protein CSA75_05505 [Sorangium cellulosum]
MTAQSGRAKLGLNGHLHWSHEGIHNGIPYVTIQSLIENLEPDVPGRIAQLGLSLHWMTMDLRCVTEGGVPNVFPLFYG